MNVQRWMSYLGLLLASAALTACGADTGSANDGNNGANNGGDPAYAGNNGGADYAADENYQAGENYEEWEENDFIDTSEENTSTFSIDVDNASYTLMRRDLNNGVLPHVDGVRPEEYINFFEYDYPEPDEETPFSINLEVAPSEFSPPNEDLHMLRIGLQGRDISPEDMKASNLVFLIDVSGSMQSDKKLPLVKESLYSLLDHLRGDDTVGIVTYAGNSGVVLDPTPVSDDQAIRAAIENLAAGGSTNGEAGIVNAYDLAEQARIEGGNNRVIILTDGDFNVGRTGDDLVELIRENRDKHISLTAVGYGLGNFNDATMEALARDGNGNYFYVDSIDEAKRIFGTDLASTLEVIASDVKIQVEFAADTVKRYRLVGYENRVLDNEDFEDDTKDAGEIGPGHTVTALYELEIDEEAQSETGILSEVRLRYKEQYGEASVPYDQAIKLSQVKEKFEDASDGFQFAIAVAEYAEILRESKHSEGDRFDDVRTIAKDASRTGDTKQEEFVELVEAAQGLWPR